MSTTSPEVASAQRGLERARANARQVAHHLESERSRSTLARLIRRHALNELQIRNHLANEAVWRANDDLARIRRTIYGTNACPRCNGFGFECGAAGEQFRCQQCQGNGHTLGVRTDTTHQASSR